MIENGADVHACDYRHFTPLHYATKSGSERNTLLLLDNGADPNSQGHRLKTPLHKARTPKVVEILTSSGGNQYLKMMDKSEAEKCGELQCRCNLESTCEKGVHSVFSTLLHRNDKSAEVVLNEHITTNDQKLDSCDLLIVYDLHIFQNESEHLNVVINEEMSGHSEIIHLKSSLLTHPICQVMLELKWNCLSTYFWMSFIPFFMFLLFLSGLTIYQTYLLSGYEAKNETVTAICLDNTFADECYLIHVLRATNQETTFYVIYGIVLLHTLYLFVRELVQVCYNWVHYSRSWEDRMEALLIVITILYLLGVFRFPIFILKSLAAWSVFLAWMEMILLVGRFPDIGIYVHMFFHVSKILAQYIAVYSPALVAFAMAFYILLSNTEPFINPLNSFLKTLVMLIGELEYEGNFMWQSPVNGYPYFPSTQLLLVLFMLFGCIVIMNLLIGLAVSEIDVVRDKAKRIRLKKTVYEIVRLEDLLVKKPTILDWLPTCCQEKITHRHSLFSRLKDVMDIRMKIRTHGTPFMVCVRPTRPKVKPRQGKEKDRVYSNTSYPVYFYNEDKGRFGAETGFELPKGLVLETLEWLRKNHEDIENGPSNSDASTSSTAMHAGEYECNADENEENISSSNVQDLVKIRNDINKILSSLNTTGNDQ